MNDPAKALAGLPHDVRGLAAVPSPYLRWGLVVAGCIVAALLVWLLVSWWRRRRHEPDFVIDPWTDLVARIRAIALPTADDDRGREDYYYGLSLLLREGIERRTGLSATDMTLAELRAPLKNRLPLRTNEVDDVLLFLERADMVKFAEARATIEGMTADREAVRGWVEGLRPREGDAERTIPSREPTQLAGGTR